MAQVTVNETDKPDSQIRFKRIAAGYESMEAAPLDKLVRRQALILFLAGPCSQNAHTSAGTKETSRSYHTDPLPAIRFTVEVAVAGPS